LPRRSDYIIRAHKLIMRLVRRIVVEDSRAHNALCAAVAC